MKKSIKHKIEYFLYPTIDDLTIDVQRLISHAEDALKFSYSPYSNYQVGASVLFNDQTYIRGANQENASYPLCICAEASVLAHAGSYYNHKIIEAMAITTRGLQNSKKQLAAPCGGCRQIILEFEARQNHPIKIFLYQPGLEIMELPSVKTILPFHFDNSHLGG